MYLHGKFYKLITMIFMQGERHGNFWKGIGGNTTFLYYYFLILYKVFVLPILRKTIKEKALISPPTIKKTFHIYIKHEDARTLYSSFLTFLTIFSLTASPFFLARSIAVAMAIRFIVMVMICSAVIINCKS